MTRREFGDDGGGQVVWHTQLDGDHGPIGRLDSAAPLGPAVVLTERGGRERSRHAPGEGIDAPPVGIAAEGLNEAWHQFPMELEAGVELVCGQQVGEHAQVRAS